MADQTKKKTIQLRVARGPTAGRGCGCGTVESGLSSEVGLKERGFSRNSRKEKHCSSTGVAYLADEGIDIVRMDGLVRAHASEPRSSPYERRLTVD